LDLLKEAKDKLLGSSTPVVMTGAGISAESGVPTFRGEDGLWKNFRAEELATPGAFSKDPVLVWEWYDWRRQKISEVSPNAAHYALAELEKRHPGLTLITQNVDGLHVLAGSENVLELHGSIWRVRCTGCGALKEDRTVPLEIPPKCGCGALLRPDVVWFGEQLPVRVIEDAFTAASNADLVMVIGTSGVVQPAASLAVRAKNSGAFVIEINIESTPLTDITDVFLRGKAAQTLPALL
jgi:NAD-dependent deacetylase